MKNIFIDIGSEKTLSFITQVRNKQHKIISHSITKSSNFDNTLYGIDVKTSLSYNLEQLKKKNNMSFVRSAYVSVPSSTVSKRYENFQISILSNNTVAPVDILRIKEKAEKHLSQNNKKIIHVIPVEFNLNGEEKIYNPIGKKGSVLQAKLLIIEIDLAIYSEIKKVLEHQHLYLAKIYLDSYASSFSVLAEKEKDEGSILIDFGGAKTCIMFFHKNEMIYFKNINSGFSSILNGIIEEFGLTQSDAIKVRNLFVIGYKQMSLNSNIYNDFGKIIKLDKISHIIGEQVNNIVQSTTDKIIKNPLNELCGNNIVITGGGAVTPYLIKAIGESLATPRVSELKQFSDIIGENSNPGSYACVLGMIEAENEYLKKQDQVKFREKAKIIFKNLIKWIND